MAVHRLGKTEKACRRNGLQSAGWSGGLLSFVYHST